MKIRIAALALLAAVVAGPAAAQMRVQVTPFYGYMMPQGNLPQTFALDRTDGTSIDIKGGAFEDRTPFLGATVGVRLFKGFTVEATVLKGTDKLRAPKLAETDVDIYSYSGGLAAELPKVSRVAPYLLAGIGVKSYDFDIIGAKSEKDVEYSVGGGVNVELSEMFAFNLQAKNLMSTFSSSLYGIKDEKQNDLFVSAGLTLSFPIFGAPVTTTASR